MTDKTNELKDAAESAWLDYEYRDGCLYKTTFVDGFQAGYAHAAELREQLKAANYLIGLVGKYYPLAEDAISFELMEYVRKYPADFTEPADNLAEVGERDGV